MPKIRIDCYMFVRRVRFCGFGLSSCNTCALEYGGLVYIQLLGNHLSPKRGRRVIAVFSEARHVNGYVVQSCALNG